MACRMRLGMDCWWPWCFRCKLSLTSSLQFVVHFQYLIFHEHLQMNCIRIENNLQMWQKVGHSVPSKTYGQSLDWNTSTLIRMKKDRVNWKFIVFSFDIKCVIMIKWVCQGQPVNHKYYSKVLTKLGEWGRNNQIYVIATHGHWPSILLCLTIYPIYQIFSP